MLLSRNVWNNSACDDTVPVFLLETVLEAGNVTIGTIGSPEPAYRMTTVPAAAHAAA